MTDTVNTASPVTLLSPAVQAIRDKLITELEAIEVTVIDNSWQHAGHSGAGGGSHLHITVVSPKFEGIGLLDQHRMVQAALKNEMGFLIHALELKTIKPSEYKAA